MNTAAQLLAKLRWSKTTKAQRRANAVEMAHARNRKLGKRARRDIARAGGIARAIKAGQRLGQLAIVAAVILWR